MKHIPITIDPYAFAERAAIREYDGGMTRKEAERAALRELEQELEAKEILQFCFLALAITPEKATFYRFPLDFSIPLYYVCSIVNQN
jgi:hypothetical protein